MQDTLGQRPRAFAAIEDEVIHQITSHIQRLGAHTRWTTFYIVLIDVGYIFLQRLYLQIDECRLAHLAETEANVLAGHLDEAGIAQCIEEFTQVNVAPAAKGEGQKLTSRKDHQ